MPTNDPKQALFSRAASLLDRTSAAVLWKYVDEDGKAFYLTERKTTAIRSPFSGQAFTPKPEKSNLAEVGKDLKEEEAKSKTALWKYTDDDGGVFYLTTRFTTTLRSPTTGKSFTPKAEKASLVEIGKSLREQSKAASTILWKYADNEGGVFYLTEKRVTALRSPLSGKPFVPKPIRVTLAEVAQELKADDNPQNVLWAYTDPEGNKFYMAERRMGTIRSPITGEGFPPKPERFTVSEVGQDLKQQYDYLKDYGKPPKRIGVAITKPRGSTNRQDVYGIYDNGTAKYEGYREGDWQTGIPLAGPSSDPPAIQFDPAHFEEVRYFEGAKEAATEVEATMPSGTVHVLPNGIRVEIGLEKFGWWAWIVSKKGERVVPLSIPRGVKDEKDVLEEAEKIIARVSKMASEDKEANLEGLDERARKELSPYTNEVVDLAVKMDGATHRPKDFYVSASGLLKALGTVFHQTGDSEIQSSLEETSKKLSALAEPSGQDKKAALSPAEKKVVDAFHEKKPAEGGRLTTDGKVLEKQGLGGKNFAKWEGDKIVIGEGRPMVKNDEEILRYMKKSIPVNDLAPDPWFKKTAEEIQRLGSEILDPLGRHPALRAVFAQCERVIEAHKKAIASRTTADQDSSLVLAHVKPEIEQLGRVAFTVARQLEERLG
jgi:ribosomal protein L24E